LEKQPATEKLHKIQLKVTHHQHLITTAGWVESQRTMLNVYRIKQTLLTEVTEPNTIKQP